MRLLNFCVRFGDYLQLMPCDEFDYNVRTELFHLIMSVMSKLSLNGSVVKGNKKRDDVCRKVEN